MRIAQQLFILLAIITLLSSCEKENDTPKTDYSIQSNSNFELTSKHENGWIKQGQYERSGEPSAEFEYYANGYIKTAKVYASYPKQHLYMEVGRSETNKPLWSKYYTPEGNLWFETKYENGFPLVKRIYSDKGTAIHSYTNAELTSVEFTSADNSNTTKTTYNKAAGTRNVSINLSGQDILNKTYPYQEQVGSGIYTGNHVPVANPFGATEASYYTLNQSFSQSPTWQTTANPIEFMYPFRLFDEFYNPGDYFATKFAVSTELYQSVIEQYPITEKGVLIGGGSYQDGYHHFQNNWQVRDSLRKIYNENPELYKLKYGNEYVAKLGYGKMFFIIGAIRNLPTQNEAANEIKKVAQKHMNNLISGDQELTTTEQGLLNKVWFEVKFFSTLKKHQNGVVINSSQSYKNAIMEVNDAEPSLVQMKYESLENL